MYERINQNSFAQFMRPRGRFRHVSKEILVGLRPDGTAVTRLGIGKTFKREQPKLRSGHGKHRRENLRRIRKLRTDGGAKAFPRSKLIDAVRNLLR